MHGDRVLRVFNQFRYKGPNGFYPGTKKQIVVKPVKPIKALFQSYPHILLVDNNIEKCQGIANGRFKNDPHEYLIVPTFDGKDAATDNALHPTQGYVARALNARIPALVSGSTVVPMVTE